MLTTELLRLVRCCCSSAHAHNSLHAVSQTALNLLNLWPLNPAAPAHRGAPGRPPPAGTAHPTPPSRPLPGFCQPPPACAGPVAGQPMSRQSCGVHRGHDSGQPKLLTYASLPSEAIALCASAECARVWGSIGSGKQWSHVDGELVQVVLSCGVQVGSCEAPHHGQHLQAADVRRFAAGAVSGGTNAQKQASTPAPPPSPGNVPATAACLEVMTTALHYGQPASASHAWLALCLLHFRRNAAGHHQSALNSHDSVHHVSILCYSRPESDRAAM